MKDIYFKLFGTEITNKHGFVFWPDDKDPTLKSEGSTSSIASPSALSPEAPKA
jgi:hypothetical protein